MILRLMIRLSVDTYFYKLEINLPINNRSQKQSLCKKQLLLYVYNYIVCVLKIHYFLFFLLLLLTRPINKYQDSHRAVKKMLADHNNI